MLKNWKLVLGISFVICNLSFVISPSGAMGGLAPKAPTAAAPVMLAEKGFLIDNFESGSLKSPRDWWTFGMEKAEVVPNKDLKGGDVLPVENYSFLLSGSAKSWYVGGAGTYLAKEGMDLSKYNFSQMDIFGNGPDSGTIKIELVDDDNGNWQAEQDPAKNYALLNDDKFVYEEKVDWFGWKRVSIPIADFVDDNPGIGDDVWNPQQVNGSGGLLQMQMICLATSDVGKVNLNVDNLMLVAKEK